MMSRSPNSQAIFRHALYIAGLALILFSTSSCRLILPRIADPSDENGEPPTFTFMVNGPGAAMTISSNQACPPDGFTNNFDTLFMSLPANRTFRFTYAVTDIGGVGIVDFDIADTTFINFNILTPEDVEITYSPGRPVKFARLVGGTTPMTSLIITGQLHTQDVRRRYPITFQAFDLAGNSIFHNFTIIVAPQYSPEVFSEGECG